MHTSDFFVKQYYINNKSCLDWSLELRRYHLQPYLLTQTTYWYAKERKTDKLDVPGKKKLNFEMLSQNWIYMI